MAAYYLGVDVGTGSARAGIFDGEGTLVASARRPIRLWQEDGGVFEQSSEDIWQAVAGSVREALAASGLSGAAIRGIGFDATCSLVVLGRAGEPLAVGASEDPARNVIVWMDHRALDQSDRITATQHRVLRHVGGVISPEMQTPKLLWLKERRPEIFHAASRFFDLADYLSFRATGSQARSICTTTCKWTYLAHEGRFDPDYFRQIGLEEFPDEGFERIGSEIAEVATPLGTGLSPDVAAELGLAAGTPVGASLIDAHAGAVGSLGGRRPDGSVGEATGELALIMGTSACVMSVTRDPVFLPGVWGPYRGALLPDLWLLEGGQSAYGAAIDYLVALHPAYPAALDAATAAGLPVLDHLEERAVALAGSPGEAARFAATIHIVPEFLGNRSPEADPHATAILSGWRLDASPESLLRLFVAGLCSLCYGTVEIVEAKRRAGIDLGSIVVSGGAARSRLLRHILADATGLEVALPATPEPVLLGSAIVGAVAAEAFGSLTQAAAAMGRIGERIGPDPALASFHARKREAYAILRDAERRVRAISATMNDPSRTS